MKMWGFEPENWSQGLVSPYLAAAGRQTNQPQEMRIWGLGWRNCSREFSGTCAPLSGQPATKKSSHRKWESEPGKTFRDSHRDIFHYLGLQAEELWAKIWHGFPCFVDCENWEEQLSNFWRTTKKWTHCSFFIAIKKLLSCSPKFFNVEGPVTFVPECGAWACNIVSGSFQALASPYLAAAGHQKIQPQEMRIWGLGWRNCSREFSGTCAPLSGRSRPPKNPATGNENLGLGLAKLL